MEDQAAFVGEVGGTLALSGQLKVGQAGVRLLIIFAMPLV